ncbi:MAG: TIR domain-containing protein, partial [Symploca sp. SIO3E6]|nr:TIR domain-containing protein [Caldora sp. SIO3E6]
ETWLKVAQKRKQHPPTQLQEEFITESLRQPPLESLDVFISYSRADSDLARKLNDNLQMQGKTTWFDQESIASGSDFQQEINRGIKACDNFLFILSPRAVNSPYCKDEVEYAASLNKRFVTVLHQPVNTADLHPELAKVQWIDFNQKDFNANFNELVRTLDIDREHVHSHTKWLQRAIEWERKDKSKDLLLRGSEFSIAQDWLETAVATNKQPVPTALQQTFTEESHQAIVAAEEAEQNRQAELLRLQEEKTKEVEARLAEQEKNSRIRFKLAVVAGFLFVGVVLSLLQAKQNLAAQVDALIRYSKTLVKSEQNFDALIEGIRAGKQLSTIFNKLRLYENNNQSKQVKKTLREALYDLKESQRLGGEGTSVVKFNPDNKTIATVDKDGKVTIWNFEWRELQTISQVELKKDDKVQSTSQSKTEGEEKIEDIFFNPGDGKIIATLSKDKALQLWNKDGDKLDYITKEENVSEVELSPDGKLIATFSDETNDRIGKLWKLEQGKLTSLKLPENEKFHDVRFIPGGKIATVNWQENTTKFWQFDDNKLNKISFLTDKDKINGLLYFIPEDKIIITINWDEKTAKIFNLAKELKFSLKSEELNQYFFGEGVEISSEGKMLATWTEDKDKVKLRYSDGKKPKILSHGAEIAGAWFSPDNQIIATASKDTMVKLWNPKGESISTLPSHSKPVYRVTFSQDSLVIATASYDKTVKLWNKEGNQLQTLYPGTVVDEVHFSPDSKTIATVGEDKTVKFWHSGSSDRQFLDHGTSVDNVSFSANDKLIVTSSSSGDNPSAQLWNLEDKPSKPLFPKEEFDRVEFSPDGKLMALFSNNNDKTTIKLWKPDQDKSPIRFITLANEPKVKFSPDGKLMAIFSNNNDKTTIKLWKPDQDKSPIRFITLANEPFPEVQFSPDGKLMAISGSFEDKQTVKLWSLEGEQPERLHYPENFDKDTANFDKVEFSPNSKLIAIFSDDEIKTGIELLKREQMKLTSLTTDDLKHERFNEVKFSPDSKWMVTSSWSLYDQGNGGKLWSVEDKKDKTLKPLPWNEQFDEVKFSPKGQLMGTINNKERTFQLWSLDKDKHQRVPALISEDSMIAYGFEFSYDGKLIATFDGSNTVRLLNQNSEELASIDVKDSINNLSFSHDNNKLAIASDSNTVVLWEWDQKQRNKWTDWSEKRLNKLVEEGCDKVKNYLENKPKSNSDRKLCGGD